MSTTLTNGLKLPDKGSVDWYADMQNNYTILDGAVGTVAEHTSQIASKAPAVHTHTKADITDFPAYGNAAGTICEGNDSRLSDARTPVAHTHTKSDVTDLLNSDFIPSANNSYNLGSSSYQWNNLYAKNYFYNGTAWGLDKDNTWTGNNQFNTTVKFSGQTGINWARGGTTGTIPSATMYYGFQNATDSNDNVFDRIRSYVSSLGNNYQEHLKYAWNDLTKYAAINFWINADGSDSEYKLSVKRVIPSVSNTTDLGDSSHKWKTLNGINPGALSLPTTNSTKWVDLSGSIVANSSYTYTPTVDGWVSVELNNNANSPLAVYIEQSAIKAACFGNAPKETGGNFYGSACIPVRANIAVNIYTRGTSSVVSSAYFMPCEGNV